MFRQLLRNAKERLRLFLSECGRRERVFRDRLRRQPDRIDPSSRFFQGFRYGYWEREARGLQLLKEWPSPEELAQYDAKSYFEVTGCHSGKRYRISHGTSMNVHELDGAGCPCVGWCFTLKGYPFRIAPTSTATRSRGLRSVVHADVLIRTKRGE